MFARCYPFKAGGHTDGSHCSLAATWSRQAERHAKSSSAAPSELEYLPMHMRPRRESCGQVETNWEQSSAHSAGKQPDLLSSPEVLTCERWEAS